MNAFFITFGLVAVLIVLMTLVLSRMAKKRQLEAEVLSRHEVTLDEVDEAIRRDIAPASRPYGDGGVFAHNDGKMYAVTTDGSARRFAIAEKENGEKEVILIKKPGKSARKAAKRARHADRGVLVAPVTQAARTADRLSAAKLARTLTH